MITELILTAAILSGCIIFTWYIKSQLHPEIERKLSAIGFHTKL